MSYILDALRRADSDRERGAVPSLHSNPLAAGPMDADDADGSARSVQPLWWAVGGLSLALLGILGWLVFGRAAPEPEAARAPEIVVAPPVVAPPPVVMAPPAVPVAPPVQEPVPAPPPRTAATKPSKPAVKAETAPAKPSAAPAAPAIAETEAVPSISELPDDIRRQLPALSVSGASYSKNAASRMLILNGQVVREGDKVANDLVLEQIRLKSAVLSYKGRRYSISF